MIPADGGEYVTIRCVSSTTGVSFTPGEILELVPAYLLCHVPFFGRGTPYLIELLMPKPGDCEKSTWFRSRVKTGLQGVEMYSETGSV